MFLITINITITIIQLLILVVNPFFYELNVLCGDLFL